MIVYIRADSSFNIGTGHIMRCLTLANQLRAANCEVSFICKALEGNIAHIVRERGFAVHMLPDFADEELTPECVNGLKNNIYLNWLKKDVQFTCGVFGEKPKSRTDWLIVDHYLIDWRWEIAIRPYVNKIMAIDDLANRGHFADILLDQNYSPDMDRRYASLVPSDCKCLVGPQYCLLRPEFIKERTNLKNRGCKIGRILVFFGGSDPTGETLKALGALKGANLDNIGIDVVVGAANSMRLKIEEFLLKMPQATFHFQSNEMAKLMAHSDIAIGAVGASTWERCYLGLPTIAIAVADNQSGAKWLDDYGVMVFLGRSDEVSGEKIVCALNRLIQNPSLVYEMSRKCFEIMRGHQEDKIVSLLTE